MTRLLTSLLVACALAAHGAEVQDPGGIQLRPLGPVAVETVPDMYVEGAAGKRTFISVGSWHCDSSSNIYFVPATPATLDRLDRIVRISPDGKLLTLFPGTDSDGSARSAGVRSRSIGPDGRLHVLVQSEISGSVRQRILSFTTAGQLDATGDGIQLPTLQIVGQHFALAETGERGEPDAFTLLSTTDGAWRLIRAEALRR